MMNGRNRILIFLSMRTRIEEDLSIGRRTSGGYWLKRPPGELFSASRELITDKLWTHIDDCIDGMGNRHMGLVELRHRALRPTQAKKEGDIARCIEEMAGINSGMAQSRSRLQGFARRVPNSSPPRNIDWEYCHRIDMKLAEECGKYELLT